MRAMVIRGFGDSSVLEPANVPAPVCGRKELLVRVRAAGVNPIDWKLRRGMFRFLFQTRLPLVLGFDVAGLVMDVGADVAGFLPGDRVVASCSPRRSGAYAEFVAVPAAHAVHLPDDLSMAEGAAIPGSGCTALQALRDVANLCPGNEVLIIGASGGVGTFAVQIARTWRASVTGVCSGRNVPLVGDLGAHRVIDYQTQDVWDREGAYDVVFDAVAAHEFAQARPALKRRGVYISTLPNGRRILRSLVSRISPGPTLRLVMVRRSGPDLAVLVDLAVQDRVRPVIDRVFPLAEVAAAHELSESGRARGKIVLSVAEA